MSVKNKELENWEQQDKNSGQHDTDHVLVEKVTLIKMCRRKPKQRLFHLFNDTLVYGKPAGDSKIISQHVIPLEEIKIEDIQNDNHMMESSKNLRNGWVIYTTFKSFAVYSESEEEKKRWMALLNSYIESRRQQTGHTKDAKHYAAVWVPDFEVRSCMVCDSSQFNIINRRHHCRKCGRVVCRSCSKHKAILPKQSSKPLRVCKECYDYIEKVLTPTNSVNKAKKELEVSDNVSIESAHEAIAEVEYKHCQDVSPNSSELSLSSLEVKRITES